MGMYGVLNLVICVVVDIFAEQRERDVRARAEEMEDVEFEEKRVLNKIFTKIDADNSGSLTFSELQEGAERVAEFAQWLRVLDIDSQDLHQLFQMVDADGSGEIDPNEFIEAMYRLKHTESKTATRFVKQLVTDMSNQNG